MKPFGDLKIPINDPIATREVARPVLMENMISLVMIVFDFMNPVRLLCRVQQRKKAMTISPAADNALVEIDRLRSAGS